MSASPSAIKVSGLRKSFGEHVVLDGQRLGAVGGETALECPDYASATDRYEVVVTGGANNVSVLTT